MGVYIKDVQKPKACAECELWSLCFYPKAPKEIDDRVMPDCPLEEIDLVRCGECKWWDKDGESPYGYCHAEKHCHFSSNWEISIYRKYKADHFCSDGERSKE